MLLSFFFALIPFSRALTSFGHSLAPSSRALQGLPFKIRCLVQRHCISYCARAFLLSPKHPLVTLEGWDFTGILVGHRHALGLWWNSGCHRTVPHAKQSQCLLKSLLCRIQPCNASGHKPWHLPQVFFGGRQQLLVLFCPLFKHWKLGCVAIYSWSQGDKQMATVPER